MIKDFFANYAPARNDRGFALLVVILVTGLLAFIATAFSLAVRTEVRTVSIAIENAKAEAIADGAVHLAISALLIARKQGSSEWRFPPDGSSTLCTLLDGLVLIRIEDEFGKVDINGANDLLLRSVFVGMGVSEADAASYADAIIDFRDSDHHRRPNGAEAPEYRAAGLTAGPKNGAFLRVSELAQVIGLNSIVVERLSPYLTVHTGQRGLDPIFAPDALKAAIAQGYAQLGLATTTGLYSTNAGAPLLPSEFATRSPQRIFAIRAEARTHKNSVFVREAIVEITPARTGIAYSIKEWRRGRGVSPDLYRDSDGIPSCS